MRKFYTSVLLLSVLYAMTVYFCHDLKIFKEILNALSGHTVDWVTTSLTMSSLLFMLQGFVIPYTQKSVYENPRYIEYLKGVYKANWQQEQYRPLKNLSDCLMLSILTSLLSTVLILLGIISYLFTAIAVFLASISFVGIILSLFSMKRTLDYMFKNY